MQCFEKYRAFAIAVKAGHASLRDHILREISCIRQGSRTTSSQNGELQKIRKRTFHPDDAAIIVSLATLII